MSVSHPNVVITHKMAIVKVAGGGSADTAAAAAAEQQQQQQQGREGRASGSSGSRKGSGHLVPALDGSGGMVEIVSPSEVLQPGLYETWLVSAFKRGAFQLNMVLQGGAAGLAARSGVGASFELGSKLAIPVSVSPIKGCWSAAAAAHWPT